jgi:Flp pilus assembly pilin Flp
MSLRGAVDASERDRNSHTRDARRYDAREDTVMALVNFFRSFAKDESGQDLLEYALLVALIALVAFGAIQLAGQSVNNIFSNIATKLAAAS